MDRETLQITVHQQIESSSWYSTQTSDGLFLAGTTVEKGPGVQTDRASLLVSENGVEWRKVISFRKDFWPMKYFKFGVISFPSGSYSSKSFWISGEALKGLDGCSMLCSLEDKPET